MIHVSKIFIIAARIIFVYALLLSVSVAVSGQSESDLPAELGLALGVYRLNMDRSSVPGLGDFEEFVMEAYPGQDVENPFVQRDGTVKVTGYLTAANVKFKFRECKLQLTKDGKIRGIEFSTVVVDGMMYHFKGAFLEHSVQERHGGDFTKIRGTMEKTYRGQVLRGQELPFSEYAEL